MKNLFELVNKIALGEISKYGGGPNIHHYNLSLVKGEEIAKHYNLDVDMVKTGIALMDIKLGECINNGIQNQHVQKSYEYAKQILSENSVDPKTSEILLDCVMSHHNVGMSCNSKYAEAVANADCYRFVDPQGVFTFIQISTKRGLSQNESIDAVLAKLEEKHNILSLDYCKKELEPLYQQIKTLLLNAKIK